MLRVSRPGQLLKLSFILQNLNRERLRPFCYSERLASAITKTARTSVATPANMNRIGCLPVFFHSPVARLQTLAVITIKDINDGQPRTGPSEPSRSLAIP